MQISEIVKIIIWRNYTNNIKKDYSHLKNIVYNLKTWPSIVLICMKLQQLHSYTSNILLFLKWLSRIIASWSASSSITWHQKNYSGYLSTIVGLHVLTIEVCDWFKLQIWSTQSEKVSFPQPIRHKTKTINELVPWTVSRAFHNWQVIKWQSLLKRSTAFRVGKNFSLKLFSVNYLGS